MDVVGVMAAYLPWCVCVLHSLERHCVCTAQSTECLSRLCSTQQICCDNTVYAHINGHDRTTTLILAKHCIQLRDDGSLVIRNMLELFQIFYNNSIYICEFYVCSSVG